MSIDFWQECLSNSFKKKGFSINYTVTGDPDKMTNHHAYIIEKK